MKRNQQLLRRATLHLEPLEDRCLLSAGALDPTFGSGGIVTTSFTDLGAGAAAVAIYHNQGPTNEGKIVAAGYAYPANNATYADLALARYNPNGALDTTFGAGGKLT